MDRSYADGRQRAPHLKWRYRVRAAFAANAFRDAFGANATARVLDLGAAEGLTLMRLRELLGPGGTYDGIELSDSLLAAAPPTPENVRLLRGDVTSLPEEVAEGSYNLCAALAVLEHLPNPEACVREAFRALEPGGVFVATCPHPIWDEIAGKLGMVADEHHEDHMTGDKMRRIAESAGFRDAHFEPFMWAPVGFLPYLRVSPDPEQALRVDGLVRRLPLMRSTFVNQGLVARKP
jgi:SAM-dependent methyltransferase